MRAVPRGVRKHALTLLLAALLVAGLAACGSSDDSTTGATTTATSTPSGEQGSNAGGHGQSEGSAPFREPGGDNSIQDYGEEASESERDAAEKALAAFMAARAKQDWVTTCDYLGEEAVKPLEELGKSNAQLKGKDCAQLLEAVTERAPAASFVNTLRGPVASLRVERDRAFALYHGPQQINYFMVMIKEGDEWKVGSLSPSEFPGSGR